MNWFPKSKIVVPVEFSGGSFEAVEVGLSLVDDPSHLHVIHVMEDLTTDQPGMLFNILDEAQRRDQTAQALADRLSDAKFDGIEIHVAFGDPAHAITEFAEKIDADMIVMPSHGRTG